ncbi:hypothetical protein NKG94_22600 [Micromonospora sp. M12]
MAVDVNDVLKSQFGGEPVGAAEGLGGEPREVFDMARLASGEHAAQHGVVQHLGIEQFLQTMQHLVAAAKFVQSGH